MSASRPQTFSSLPYKRIDLKDIAEKMRRARLRIRLAMNPESAADAVVEGQKAIQEYEAMANLAKVRHDLDVDNEYYRREQEFYDRAGAEFGEMKQELYSAMISTRFRDDLEKKFGSHLFRRAEYFRQTVSLSAVDDLERENKLESAYNQLIAQGRVNLAEKTYSLKELEPLFQSSDRPTRSMAWKALSEWSHHNGEEFDNIFSQLVNTRNKISSNLGFASFPDLAEIRMERFDYTSAEIDSLRQNILRYIVPLAGEIRKLQRQRLNLERLYSYDLPCLLPDGDPGLQCSLQEMPRVAARVLADLAQRPSVLANMLDSGYIDYLARPGKFPGAYCVSLYEQEQPFILMNASGISQDVFTLMHETGHAYASSSGMAKFQLHDLYQPSLDASEIHSTAMEYLAYPYMDRFFGQMAEQAALMHMTRALLFLPYCCLIDDFQHRIYKENMTQEQRNSLYRELEAKYLPQLEYDDDQFFSEGRAWQLNNHIFTAPFYYIDYVLAQIAALDIWQQSRIDYAGAFGRYDLFCSMGGSAPYRELLEKSGIASPFETSTIKRLAYAACDFLSL